MKKQTYIVILLVTLFSKFASAQLLCIHCYDQNDTISANVNNLMLNGGFENGCNVSEYFCPNSNFYSCDITNWTCTNGGTGTYAKIFNSNQSFIPEGTKAPYFGNWHCLACSSTANDTSCLNNFACVVTGIPIGYPLSEPTYGGVNGVSLEQTVNGLVIGNTYVLEFWAGGEAGAYWRNGLFSVDVGFGNTMLSDKPTFIGTGIGTRYIIEFNSTSSSHTIKFTNWGHICQPCTELVLDDVRLYTLAELDASVPHCTLGMDNSTLQNEANIFPNPITNKLNVKINNNQLSELILYDIASRKLLQQNFTSTVSLNTEQLAKGLYLYEVRSKKGLCKKGKVVKD